MESFKYRPYNLQQDEVIEVRVAAVGLQGRGEFSPSRGNIRMIGPPSKVTGLRLERNTGSEILIAWDSNSQLM